MSSTIGSETIPGDRPNPYVGPRALRMGEPLYGRDREVMELRDVLIAQRIVLLYSPSGAGKSSLLEAGLRPELVRAGFGVPPPIRVGHEAPPSLAGAEPRNRYLLSVLLSLEEGRPTERQLDPEHLATTGLDEYLDAATDLTAGGSDLCLYFDQFEELFTLDPTDVGAKTAFLEEVGVALRNSSRWALFAMREDFIAQLDPFLNLIPKRLGTRIRLDLLSAAAAKSAARRPAEALGVPFRDVAADRLIDDLRRVRVQRGEGVFEDLGPYVEPVQLQVVCRRLWEALPLTTTGSNGVSIELDDVVALGNVDDALARFYVDAVANAAAVSGVSEREIRGWFDDHLITEQNFRNQVLDGPGANGAVVLRELENAHLIRADTRRGATWYELAHDRLVAPIRRENALWRDQALSTLQREAISWDRQSRPAGLLLTGSVLADAEAWAKQYPFELIQLDHDYLEACRAEAGRARAAQRAARRTRVLAVASSALAVLAVIGLLVATLAWRSSASAETKARRAAAEALDAKTRADDALAAETAAKKDADVQRQAALAAADQAKTEKANAVASAQAATDALAVADAEKAKAVESAGIAEYAKLVADNERQTANEQRDIATYAGLVAENERKKAAAAAKNADAAAKDADAKRKQADAARASAVRASTEVVSVLKSLAAIALQKREAEVAAKGGNVVIIADLPIDQLSGHCSSRGNVASVLQGPAGGFDSSTPYHTLIHNTTGRDVSMSWVGTDPTVEAPWDRLAAGATLDTSLLNGWAWVFTDDSGGCVAFFPPGLMACAAGTYSAKACA